MSIDDLKASAFATKDRRMMQKPGRQNIFGYVQRFAGIGFNAHDKNNNDSGARKNDRTAVDAFFYCRVCYKQPPRP